MSLYGIAALCSNVRCNVIVSTRLQFNRTRQSPPTSKPCFYYINSGVLSKQTVSCWRGTCLAHCFIENKFLFCYEYVCIYIAIRAENEHTTRNCAQIRKTGVIYCLTCTLGNCRVEFAKIYLI